MLELHASLTELAADNSTQPPHARAFAAWIQADRINQAPVLLSLAIEATAAERPSRQTAHAAVLGYAASLDATFVTPFAEAVTWLRERQYFTPGRPPTFEADGLGLLGVAVGIIRLDAEARAPAQRWLEELLKR